MPILATVSILALFVGFVLMKLLHQRWFHEAQPVLIRVLDICIIVCLIAFAWVTEIGVSQLRPHLVTTSINGHVLDSLIVTNPMYYTYEQRRAYNKMSGNVEYYDVRVTNYYWHVWSIFKRK